MTTRTNFRLRFGALLAAAAFVLVACQTEETRNIIDQQSSQAQQSLVDAKQPPAEQARHYNPLVVTDKVWTGDVALRMHRGMPLPEKFETARGITLISSEPMSLADIAAAVGAQTGIPVRIADLGRAAAPAAGGASASMPIAYEGPLSGLLERISGYFSINWRYDGNSISISRFETKVFVIESLPGSQTMQDATQSSSTGGSSGGGSGGGGGGGGGGSSGGGGGSSGSSTATSSLTQNASYSITIKYWEELTQTVTSMLGGVGTVVPAPSAGTLTVTTTPEVMQTIAKYLEEENKRASRQIAIDVQVYNITLQKSEDFTIAFSTILHRLDNAASISYTGPNAPTSAGGLTGLGTLSIGLINPDHNPKLTDVFGALSAIGDTTQVADFPMTTINNRPVTRRVGRDIAYVASITNSSVGTTATNSIGSSVTPGVINAGFSLALTPRLLDDGRIILQYSLSIIDVSSIVNFCSSGSPTFTDGQVTGCGDSGGDLVQLPTTTDRSFVQQSVLKSGSTLILGGVNENDVTQNLNGEGSPYNYWLGGGASNANTRTMMFIAITPQVIDPPRAEQD